jgi:hypothetical protein
LDVVTPEAGAAGFELFWHLPERDIRRARASFADSNSNDVARSASIREGEIGSGDHSQGAVSLGASLDPRNGKRRGHQLY